MIRSIKYIFADGTDPYRNLALEECLLRMVEPDECLLYLWQNAKTVVIGRNQNCWKECRVEELESEGGRLARRLSGGGAVFHDMGNLNFTFFASDENYDVARQLDILIAAVAKLGVNACRSGRNDVTADGRKFSGNAFYRIGNRRYHHGTILVDVDMVDLSRYLNVSGNKLKSKGVSSVRSRVVNLSELAPGSTVVLVREKLIEAFEDVYGMRASFLPVSAVSEGEISERTARFASDEWRYGACAPFEYEISRRFDWGEITIQLHVEKGVVRDANVWTDAMDVDFASLLPQSFVGARFSAVSLNEAVSSLPSPESLTLRMSKDIRTLISEEIS